MNLLWKVIFGWGKGTKIHFKNCIYYVYFQITEVSNKNIFIFFFLYKNTLKVQFKIWNDKVTKNWLNFLFKELVSLHFEYLLSNSFSNSKRHSPTHDTRKPTPVEDEYYTRANLRNTEHISLLTFAMCSVRDRFQCITKHIYFISLILPKV